MTQYLTLQPMRVRLLALFIVWALHIVLPLALQGVPYAVFILTQMVFFTAFAFSFNFLFGFTRQLYLCIGAFAGISAYVTGIAVRDGLTGVLEAVVLGTLLTTALGWIVSVLSVRRRLVVIFTGIFTLAITLVFNNMVVGLVSITGGETGFRIRLADLGPLEVLPKNLRFYYVVTAVLIVLTAISYHMVYRTKVGYAYRCIMDDEFSAELVGINVSRVKTLTAALFLGFGGFNRCSVWTLQPAHLSILLQLHSHRPAIADNSNTWGARNFFRAFHRLGDHYSGKRGVKVSGALHTGCLRSNTSPSAGLLPQRVG
jgi:branched-chain amino acid transport system permease protein